MWSRDLHLQVPTTKVGYLFWPLEDSSYFTFKVLLIHTCLGMDSYFGEDSTWLPANESGCYKSGIRSSKCLEVTEQLILQVLLHAPKTVILTKCNASATVF